MGRRKNPARKKSLRENTTGNQGRNRAQALQPILRGKKRYSEWCQRRTDVHPRLIPSLNTHPPLPIHEGTTSCCFRATEIFNFSLIYSDSIARNSINWNTICFIERSSIVSSFTQLIDFKLRYSLTFLGLISYSA